MIPLDIMAVWVWVGAGFVWVLFGMLQALLRLLRARSSLSSWLQHHRAHQGRWAELVFNELEFAKRSAQRDHPAVRELVESYKAVLRTFVIRPFLWWVSSGVLGILATI